MTNLNETIAGRELLRMLRIKYATDDPQLLLGIVLMEPGVLETIFSEQERREMYKRTLLHGYHEFSVSMPLTEVPVRRDNSG